MGSPGLVLPPAASLVVPRPLSAARLRAQLPEMRRPFSAWYRTVDDAPLRVYGDMYGDDAVAGRARSSSP